MSKALPQFTRPPVVETVLGVQFDTLPNFTTAHAGIFWSECLGEDWPTVREASRLGLIDEAYGGVAFRRHVMGLATDAEPNRLQILNTAQDRMLQLQDSRLVLNWRKTGSEYPHYAPLRDEFGRYLALFQAFLRKYGYPELKLSRWEITYVNHLDRGNLWGSVSDWDRIFPGLFLPLDASADSDLETFDAQWQFGLQKDQGRLRVQLRHIKKDLEGGADAIDLRFIATGMLSSAGDLAVRMEIGHEAIVSRFTKMTSAYAHERWGRSC